MSTINKNALDFFKTNPNVNEVFATTDGYVFVKKLDATNHAKTLNPDSPEVEPIKNEEQPVEDKKEGTVKLSVAELKALKDKATQEYTELFGSAPDSKLSGAKIQELNDAKKTELANENPDDEEN
ncbi:hypothetical protein [Chryseobacterium herbae]|uniref:Uncharacterized protein n=1 Tax=Chryseobacterium herbae TaxID=2976476 RepID=A0ABT2IYM8_9FLAO|nr:hypothetical protein [Chryseobacterium sp. pc1-10]MCT2563954.1 hypothetical protein [Chryseobacterium sp. pc1-10]